jgi:enoyl-CoA hydratase/carnithine racemase
MIEVSHQGDIAMVKMVHGKANAMDVELCEALAAQFAQLQSSRAKAIVLTGQGRMFSAGVDLVRLAESGGAYVRKLLPALNAMFVAVFCSPKPVVAALNGHAIAGGCVLASCADRRLMASESGRVGVTELLVGVAFPSLAFEAVRFVASPRYFPEVIYGGATYPPEAAVERGLVDEIVAPQVLIERAVAAAQAFAAVPAQSFAMTKRQMRAPVLERLERCGQSIDAAVEDLWASPEVMERTRGYVARVLKKS